MPILKTLRGDRSRVRLRVATALAAFALISAAPTSSKSAFESFRSLRGEIAKLAGDGQPAAALDLVDRADAIVRNYPPLLVEAVRLSVRLGNRERAFGYLERLVATGRPADIMTEDALGPLRADPRFKALLARDASNRSPKGTIGTIFELPDRFMLIEAAAWDGPRARWLVSSIRERTIHQWTQDAGLAPFLSGTELGIFGLAIDVRRDRLWAASSGVPEAASLPESDRGRVALLEIELSSGKVVRRHAPTPATGAEHHFGDVTVAEDGGVYVADAANGALFVLRPAAKSLAKLVPEGVLASPQGMVVTPDRSRLIVADYPTGLHEVDLKTGRVRPLPVPRDASLMWIDGLIRRGDSLFAVQNMGSPPRVVELRMDPSFARVRSVTTFASDPAKLPDPTTLSLRGRDLVVVSNSQWAASGPDGTIVEAAVRPAALAVLGAR